MTSARSDRKSIGVQPNPRSLTMKSINDDKQLWTTLSVEELEKREEYAVMLDSPCCFQICCVDCCFNIRIEITQA